MISIEKITSVTTGAGGHERGNEKPTKNIYMLVCNISNLPYNHNQVLKEFFLPKAKAQPQIRHSFRRCFLVRKLTKKSPWLLFPTFYLLFGADSPRSNLPSSEAKRPFLVAAAIYLTLKALVSFLVLLKISCLPVFGFPKLHGKCPNVPEGRDYR